MAPASCRYVATSAAESACATAATKPTAGVTATTESTTGVTATAVRWRPSPTVRRS